MPPDMVPPAPGRPRKPLRKLAPPTDKDLEGWGVSKRVQAQFPEDAEGEEYAFIFYETTSKFHKTTTSKKILWATKRLEAKGCMIHFVDPKKTQNMHHEEWFKAMKDRKNLVTIYRPSLDMLVPLQVPRPGTNAIRIPLNPTISKREAARFLDWLAVRMYVNGFEPFEDSDDTPVEDSGSDYDG